jgi:hypothetical protein
VQMSRLTLDTLNVLSMTEDYSASRMVRAQTLSSSGAIARNQYDICHEEQRAHVFHLLYVLAETRKHPCERLITKYPMMDQSSGGMQA